MTPPLRSAAPHDAPALFALQAGAFDMPWSEAAIARMLAAPEGFAVVAGETSPQGFALARATGDDSELLILVVQPESRGRGLGRALTVAAADLAAARGARSLFLEVASDNGLARGLYETLGFVEAGVRRAYYHRPGRASMDAHILRLTL